MIFNLACHKKKLTHDILYDICVCVIPRTHIYTCKSYIMARGELRDLIQGF